MRGLIGFGVVALVSGAAFANPSALRIKNGSTVRVSLHGKREAGVGLRPKDGAWKVELGGSKESAGDTIELVDVTEGANNAKWDLTPTDGVLKLGADRFIAGHAYRVTVLHGMDNVVASALIYLYPPTMSAKSKVSFDDADALGGLGSDDIATVKKPSL